MAEPLYALNSDDVAVLRQVVQAWRAGDLGRPLQQSRRPLPERCNVVFGKADSGIPALGTDPGSGTLSLHHFTSTGGTTDSGLDETAYNVSSVARTSDEFTVAVRDYHSGHYMAIAGSGGSGYKRLVRFILDAAMATSDEYVAALITNQYGDGTAHSTTSSINAYNMDAGGSYGYLFEGSSGWAGLAYHDTDRNFRILQLFQVCT